MDKSIPIFPLRNTLALIALGIDTHTSKAKSVYNQEP